MYLVSKTENTAAITITCSNTAIKDGLKANELIKKAAEIIGGKGGGHPEFAQAGSKNATKLTEAITHLTNSINN